ncbi:MAG: hypothetical protein C0606_07885 [Hyphomicrobiales bacterium]|nr:MAG: hypothetical protein C0606_07885 [Hyphomicrobiales bacterium]
MADDRDGGMEGALSRWSQRKAEARKMRRGSAAPRIAAAEPTSPELAETAAEIPAAAEDAAQVLKSDPDAPGTLPPLGSDPAEPLSEEDARALTEELGLPALDELNRESDYTGFLAKGVPAALKNAALRKLWVSDPVLANIDKLNDYDEDYRAAQALGEAVKTAYRVGKGFLDDDEIAPPSPANAEAATDGEQIADTAAKESVAESGEADAFEVTHEAIDAGGSDPVECGEAATNNAARDTADASDSRETDEIRSPQKPG